jgi:hypothetical protein
MVDAQRASNRTGGKYSIFLVVWHIFHTAFSFPQLRFSNFFLLNFAQIYRPIFSNISLIDKLRKICGEAP